MCGWGIHAGPRLGDHESINAQCARQAIAAVLNVLAIAGIGRCMFGDRAGRLAGFMAAVSVATILIQPQRPDRNDLDAVYHVVLCVLLASVRRAENQRDMVTSGPRTFFLMDAQRFDYLQSDLDIPWVELARVKPTKKKSGNSCVIFGREQQG